MTDRYHALTVILEPNFRSDDAQPLIEAIKLLRGVVAVKPEVADLDTAFALENARSELGRKLWEVLYPKETDK